MPTTTLGSGVTLSYWTQGEIGDPTIVLLPGPTDSWRSYQPILDAAPPSVRVVAVSLRGHGDSLKPGSGYSIEHLSADVVPFLDALEIEHATLVGHSGSGLVARRVALQAPDRVNGLVLEATPTTLRNNPKLREFVDTVVSRLTDPIEPDFARTFVTDTSSDVLPKKFVEALVKDLVKVPVRVWKEMFASLLVYDDTTDLSLINAPVLLVWGDADPLVPRSMQDDLARRIARIEFVIYPGVGHTPRWEEPERFANDVARFALNASSQREAQQ